KGQMMVNVGDVAPDFTLIDQNGNPFRLYDVIGQKSVVLFFYPKAFSGGCTAEACAFRDSYEQFKEIGAEVIGISSDTPEVQKKFAARYNLSYPVLSDKGGAVRKAWQVPKILGLMSGRVTYVLDQQGVVRHLFVSALDIEAHIREALEGLSLA